MTSLEQARSLPRPQPQAYRGGMSLAEAFRVAFQGLLANKLRTLLTMLGVIIGVGSFIAMYSLGQGGAKASREIIQRLGTNVLSVFPNRQRRGAVSMGLGSGQRFTLEDVAAIAQLEGVKAVAPEYRGRARIEYRNNNESSDVMGTTPEYFPIRNVSILEGQFFTQEDVQLRRKVCVLGYELYTKLFGDEPCINRIIKINRRNFRVVGLAAPKGATAFRNMDDMAFIPLDTAMRRVFGVDYLGGASVQAESEQAMSAVQTAIEDLMTDRHRAFADEEPPVRVFSQGDFLEVSRQQSTMMTGLLAGIALVSLFVGGIGIMNIMLVSVTERTREIGIRKALGAKNRDILNQFLIESMTISLMGGALGGLVGVGCALGFQLGPKWPVVLGWEPVLLSFVFAAGVGVVFGIYPALKAARLNPIEALRYE